MGKVKKRGCCEDARFKMFQSNWDEDNKFSPQYIQNKPDVLTSKSFERVLEGYVKMEDYDELIRAIGDPSEYNNLQITLLSDLVFRYGVNVVNNISNMPVTKQSVIANLFGNNQLSFSGAMLPGQVINVKVVPSVALTVYLPTTAKWTLMDDSEFDLEPGQVAEINVWCTGVGEYSVKTVVSK